MGDEKNDSLVERRAVEKVYRELVLQELKELSTAVREVTTISTDTAQELKSLLQVIKGYQADGADGIICRLVDVEKQVKYLTKLKVQLFTGFIVLQTIAGIVFAVILNLMEQG